MKARRISRRTPRRTGRSSAKNRSLPYRRPLRVELLEDRRLLSVASPDIELFSNSPATFVENQGQWSDQPLAEIADKASGQIGGNKWHDLDGDGQRDDNEPDLAGTHLYVDLNDNGQWDDGEPDDWTNANGNYTISGLAAGTYTVAEDPQDGWEQTFPYRSPGSGELSFVQVRQDDEYLDGLDDARSVVASPDGRHLYVVGYNDHEIVVFGRDPETGQLTPVETIRNGQDHVYGLYGPRSVAISPDGEHVYVSVSGDDAGVLTFRRSAETGRLLFGGRDIFYGSIRSLNFSPDGRHAYAAVEWFDNYWLAVFRRDAATGRLSAVEVLYDGQNGIDGLDGVCSATVSPDGSQVFTTGWRDNAVAVFNRNAVTGELSFVQVLKNGQDDGQGNVVDGLNGAGLITGSPDGSHVYVIGLLSLAVFRRDAVTHELSFVQVLKDGQEGVDGLNGAISVTVSPEGSHVYTAAGFIYGDKAVAVFGRDAISGQLSFLQVLKDGQAGVDGLTDANSVIVSPDGSHVYTVAGDYGDNAVAVFGRDTISGHLSFIEFLWDGYGGTDGLQGAMSVVVSPDGEHVYAVGTDDHAVAVFSRRAAGGKLEFVQVLKNGQDDGHGNLVDGLLEAVSVTISPDGSHVYVGGTQYSYGGLAVFSRDSVTGELQFLQVADGSQGDGGIDWITVSSDGNHVYAGGSVDHGLTVFGRDALTGELISVQVVPEGSGSGMTISPDGAYAYVGMTVFSRDAATGELAFIEVTDTTGEDLSGGLHAITLSPEGSHLYAAYDGENPNGGTGTVAVFSRNPETGLLSLVEAHHENENGLEGISRPRSLMVAPDGRHLYVASDGDSAVAVFRRDLANGRLSLVDVIRDADCGVDGLDGASSLTISPDGNHLYATGRVDDALVTFHRDTQRPTTHEVVLASGETVGGIDFANYATYLTWDQAGNGHWDAIGQDGYSRWLDPAGNRVTVYPKNNSRDAIIRTDRITVDKAVVARNVTIESGAIAVSAGGILCVAGNFEMSDVAEIAVKLNGPDNGQIHVGGTAALAGMLELQAVDNLSRFPGNSSVFFEDNWGDYTRTIFMAEGGSSGTLSLVLPIAKSDQAPCTYHIGHGAFLTDEGPNGQPVYHHADSIRVYLFQTAPGDTDADGDVDISDIMDILAAGKFGDGPSDATWCEGDFDGDLDVDVSDIMMILAAGKFGTGPYVPAKADGDGTNDLVAALANIRIRNQLLQSVANAKHVGSDAVPSSTPAKVGLRCATSEPMVMPDFEQLDARRRPNRGVGSEQVKREGGYGALAWANPLWFEVQQ